MTARASRAVRIGVSAAIILILVLAARRVDWHKTVQSIAGTDRDVLALAALANLSSLVLKGVRWWIFLRSVGAGSLWLSVRATIAGAGLNNMLVADGGDAARVALVTRASHVESSSIVAALALERMFELSGYIVLLTVSVSFLPVPAMIPAWVRPLTWVALLGLGGLMVYLLRRPKSVITVVAAPATRWFSGIANFFRRFGGTIGGMSTAPRFAAAFVLSAGIWALQLWTYDLTVRAAQFSLPLAGSVAALLAVNLGSFSSVTPGNVGVFQALYVLAVAGFGMDRDNAVAVAVLIQLLQILPVTGLAVVLAPELIFRRRRAGMA